MKRKEGARLISHPFPYNRCGRSVDPMCFQRSAALEADPVGPESGGFQFNVVAYLGHANRAQCFVGLPLCSVCQREEQLSAGRSPDRGKRGLDELDLFLAASFPAPEKIDARRVKPKSERRTSRMPSLSTTFTLPVSIAPSNIPLSRSKQARRSPESAIARHAASLATSGGSALSESLACAGHAAKVARSPTAPMAALGRNRCAMLETVPSEFFTRP